MKRLNRNYQYSIRKTSLGIGSVAIGILLAGLSSAPRVAANTISTPSGAESIPTTVVTSQIDTSQTSTETSVVTVDSSEVAGVESSQTGPDSIPVSELYQPAEETSTSELQSELNPQATTSSVESVIPTAS